MGKAGNQGQSRLAHTYPLGSEARGGLGLEYGALDAAWWELGPWACWLAAPAAGSPLVHSLPPNIARCILAPVGSRGLQEAPQFIPPITQSPGAPMGSPCTALIPALSSGSSRPE